MDSIKKLLDLMADVVAKAIAPFERRLAEAEARKPEKGDKGEPGEPGAAGKDGRDGADGKGLQGEPGTAGHDGVNGKDGADGKDGRDGVDGKDGEPGVQGLAGERGAVGESGRDGVDGKHGADGLAGKDGRDGADGKDGRHGVDAKGEPGAAGKDGRDGVDGAPGAAGKDGADGLAGKDGRDGVDGKSLVVADVEVYLLQWLEANFSKWALNVERRVYDAAEKAIAAMPRPKDGVDGVQPDGIAVVGRSVQLKRDGDVVAEFKLGGLVLYKGVFEDGGEYEVGDMVTFGGSVWVAVDGAGIKGRPGTTGAWKLAVKKGRDAARSAA